MKKVCFKSELWKPEDKVVTRLGYSVRILCTDYKGETGHSVVGLVKVGEQEILEEFLSDGRWTYNVESDLDLFTELPRNQYVLDEGELVIDDETGLYILVAKSDDPREVESYITINPKDLTERREESFRSDKLRTATGEEWDNFEMYLALYGMEWCPVSQKFNRIIPTLNFSPSDDGWEVEYEGKVLKISDKEYEEFKN